MDDSLYHVFMHCWKQHDPFKIQNIRYRICCVQRQTAQTTLPSFSSKDPSFDMDTSSIISQRVKGTQPSHTGKHRADEQSTNDRAVRLHTSTSPSDGMITPSKASPAAVQVHIPARRLASTGSTQWCTCTTHIKKTHSLTHTPPLTPTTPLPQHPNSTFQILRFKPYYYRSRHPNARIPRSLFANLLEKHRT